MMWEFGFNKTLISMNAATADSYAATRRDIVHAVGRTWGTHKMVDKQKVLELIDKRIQELRDIDDPTWVYPYILQRIDECKWLKSCVVKMCVLQELVSDAMDRSK